MALTAVTAAPVPPPVAATPRPPVDDATPTPAATASTTSPPPEAPAVDQVGHVKPESLTVLHPASPRPGILGSDEAGPAAAGGAWKLFDETNATAAMVDAVDGARQVVNAEFFGFTDAGKGAQLVTALESAAKRGVEVNVITDFVSSLALPPRSWHRMRDKVEGAGGSVILTSRVPGDPRARANPALKHVDHRKVVTVDGTTGFVGGMNLVPITDGYADTMVGLTGLPAARLAADQLDRWTRVNGSATERHRRTVSEALGGAPVKPTDPTELAIVANAPEQQRFELTDGYRDAIRGAKERLWIATPGISDRDIMADVNDAARRGVDVRIIMSEKAPVAPTVGWVARAHLTDLAAAGGRSFEIPGTLHRKALIADDEVILSSYNLTKRSADADHEVGIRTKEPTFVAAIADIIQRDVDSATEFDPETFTGLTARIGKAFASRFSY